MNISALFLTLMPAKRPLTSKVLLSLAGCSLAAAAALGFVLEGQTWPQDSIVTMQLSLGGNQTLIDGFSSFNESAEDGLARWNQYMDHLQFSVVRNSSVKPTDGDRKNSVFFANTVFGDAFGNNTLAVTLRTYQGSTLLEADVVFNSAKSFNSYRGPIRQASGGGTLHDLHRIAIHEFGHVLGLDHPDEANQTVVAIMNAFEGDIDSLQTDDINGAQYLYGSATPGPTPTPAPISADSLVNLSTRGFVGTGDGVLIGGFIVQGAQPTSLVLRAIGPSLASSGIANPLSDPVLELRDGSGTLLQRNDDWQKDRSAQTISSKGLAPKDSRESALMASLASGSYTVIVHGYNGATGIGLVELYDLQATAARAGNLSTRGTVLRGEGVMIAGFIVGGDKQKPLVVRALGPSLASAGITGVLANPTLDLHNGSGALIGSNDDWHNGPDAAAIQSKGLAPANNRESALLKTLNPGSYTAIVRGAIDGTGVALVEVYDLSPPPNQ